VSKRVWSNNQNRLKTQESYRNSKESLMKISMKMSENIYRINHITNSKEEHKLHVKKEQILIGVAEDVVVVAEEVEKAHQLEKVLTQSFKEVMIKKRKKQKLEVVVEEAIKLVVMDEVIVMVEIEAEVTLEVDLEVEEEEAMIVVVTVVIVKVMVVIVVATAVIVVVTVMIVVAIEEEEISVVVEEVSEVDHVYVTPINVENVIAVIPVIFHTILL